MNENHYQVIIIGSGPAGLTAAIYTSRARLKTLVIGGRSSGGQLMITTEVENFPGFPEGIMGPKLMMDMRKQAEKFGTEFLDKDVDKVEFSDTSKKLFVENTEYSADSIIVATGASAMWLGLESESRLMGKGVSGCATCDGAFFRDKIVAVVGGGDTAMEEATFLTRFATKVYIIHRRDEFRASKIMIEKAKENPKIEFILNSTIEEILGQDKVNGVKILNSQSNLETTIDVEGVFIAIGHKPNTDFLKGQLDINEKGYLVSDGNSEILTRIPGVFIAGDVYDFRYRQAITAAGSGCKAALEAEKYLEIHNTQEAW